jgi:epoxyqueuosine reductase
MTAHTRIKGEDRSTPLPLTPQQVKELALACGFELAGVAAPDPSSDFARYDDWRSAGMAGEMQYLTDRRGDLRSDPRHLLSSVQSIVCVGKLYNTAHPHTAEATAGNEITSWISRYAWGDDYHEVLRRGLEDLRERIRSAYGCDFESKICVDTAPLLERSYARRAGLGWIGKNTCLINQQRGSWFFLGELLLSIPLAPDLPPPDRCGTCRRCIEACPTDALFDDETGTTLDARRCISYLTIEKRGDLPTDIASEMANHVFGCDICQDVCPWNSRAAYATESAFEPNHFAPPLATLATLTEDEFRAQFRHSPIWRTKYTGFLRNVAFAIANSGDQSMRPLLERLSCHEHDTVSRAAQEALQIFDTRLAATSALPPRMNT